MCYVDALPLADGRGGRQKFGRGPTVNEAFLHSVGSAGVLPAGRGQSVAAIGTGVRRG